MECFRKQYTIQSKLRRLLMLFKRSHQLHIFLQPEEIFGFVEEKLPTASSFWTRFNVLGKIWAEARILSLSTVSKGTSIDCRARLMPKLMRISTQIKCLTCSQAEISSMVWNTLVILL